MHPVNSILFRIDRKDMDKVSKLLLNNGIQYETPTEFESALQLQVCESFEEVNGRYPERKEIDSIIETVSDSELELWNSLEESVSRAVSNYEVDGDENNE